MRNFLYQVIKVMVKGYYLGMGIYNIVDNGIEFRRGVFTVILAVYRVSDRQESSSTLTWHERKLISSLLVSFHEQIEPQDLKAP